MYAAALTLGLLASLVASASQEANEILELNTFDPRQTFTAPPECRTDGGVHIIAGSGANNPPHGYGGLASTVDMLRAAFPGTSNYSVGYVKTGDINRLNAAVAQGVEMMKANIAWYAAGCPNTPIVLLGYSEGGMVVMNTLCGQSSGNPPYGTPLNSSYTKNIIAAITYGDETRGPFQPWNHGTCATGKGYFKRQYPQGCAAYAPIIRSYCDYNDPYCCLGSPNPTRSVHFSYNTTYDRYVGIYIKQRYLATAANFTSPLNSSSSSSATPIPSSSSTSSLVPSSTSSTLSISSTSSTSSTSSSTSASAIPSTSSVSSTSTLSSSPSVSSASSTPSASSLSSTSSQSDTAGSSSTPSPTSISSLESVKLSKKVKSSRHVKSHKRTKSHRRTKSAP